jgi:anti-sigma factor RsiW
VPTITCREFILDLLSDYVESILSPEVIADVERHLAECAPCRAYLATYERTARLTREAAQVTMPEDVKARLRGTLLRALSSESEAKPEPGVALPPSDPRP